MLMHRQVHSKSVKSKKRPPPKAKLKSRHGPPKQATVTKRHDRSPMHWHTPEELVRLEESAREHMHEEADESQQIGFVIQREDGSYEVRDELATQLTEEFLLSALRGEETHEILADDGDEEALGPVIETSGDKQFAGTIDEMNSDETLKEPLPTAGNWNVARPERSKRPS
jgi:hypothetical protein